MALKGLSHRHETTMKYVLDRAAEPGTVVVASGVDGRVAIVGAEEVSASGIHPMGLLLNTREEFNYAKELERVQYDTDDIGTVVTLLRDGELNTNLLVENGGVSIANGQPAYLAPDGKATQKFSTNWPLAPPGNVTSHLICQSSPNTNPVGIIAPEALKCPTSRGVPRVSVTASAPVGSNILKRISVGSVAAPF